MAKKRKIQQNARDKQEEHFEVSDEEMMSDDDDLEISEEEAVDAGDGAIDFGGNDDGPKKLTGRRAKREREAKKKMKAGTFESMGLNPNLVKAIKRKGFRLPTPIQRKSMPLILQGMDVIGMARTGSGKTAAFVIPMIEKLKAHSPKAGARALLLAPTRELALQTHKAVRDFAKLTDLRTAVLVGGDALEAQFAELAANPDIIVATPGRLLHHLAEVQGMSLRTVEYCVLDEADRLFEMGFAEQVKEILGKMSDTRQTLLFSATLPKSLADFAAAGLNAPQLVRLDADRRISPELKQLFFTVRQDEKLAALMHLIKEQLPADQLTIVFVATRHHVEYLSILLARENIPAACVFGSMDQTARKIHVAKFRAKKVCLLITTDVAARGIDIPLIDNVINVDFPAKPELFVHRVGRAARMGRAGTAYSLLTREELPYLLDLHLYLGRSVKPAPLAPSKELMEAAAAGVYDPDAPAMYGGFPDTLAGPQAERLRAVDAATAELSSLTNTLANAFSLYLKTRPAASTESVNRAKQMQKEGLHPALLVTLPETARVDLENQAALAKFTDALRTFRPSATVLEAEIASVKSSQHTMQLLDANAAKSKSTDVMHRKRAVHAAAIDRTREKRLRAAQEAAAAENGYAPVDDDVPSEDADDPGNADAKRAAMTAMALGDGVLNEGKYRDSSFFLSHKRDPNAPQDDSLQIDRVEAELQGAVLDLTAEDTDGMRDQKRRWHWDKRKKRYVQVQGAEVTAGQAATRVNTESGRKALIKGKEGKGLYQKWVKTQHKRVAATGSMEGDGGGAAVADALANRFHKTMRHKSWKTALGGAGDDQDTRKGQQLKSKDQVRKEREKKAQRKEFQLSRQNGGGKRDRQDRDYSKTYKPRSAGGGFGGGRGGGVQKNRGGGGGRGGKGGRGRR